MTRRKAKMGPRPARAWLFRSWTPERCALAPGARERGASSAAPLLRQRSWTSSAEIRCRVSCRCGPTKRADQDRDTYIYAKARARSNRALWNAGAANLIGVAAMYGDDDRLPPHRRLPPDGRHRCSSGRSDWATMQKAVRWTTVQRVLDHSSGFICCASLPRPSQRRQGGRNEFRPRT